MFLCTILFKTCTDRYLHKVKGKLIANLDTFYARA